MGTENGQGKGKRLKGSPSEYSLHHVAIVVSDIDLAMKFYQEVFQFPERERATAGISANRGVWFLMGSTELHLQERKGESKKTDQHFALVAERIEEIAKRARELGGRSEESKPLDGFAKRFFVYDPDGNRIELLESNNYSRE